MSSCSVLIVARLTVSEQLLRVVKTQRTDVEPSTVSFSYFEATMSMSSDCPGYFRTFLNCTEYLIRTVGKYLKITSALKISGDLETRRNSKI